MSGRLCRGHMTLLLKNERLGYTRSDHIALDSTKLWNNNNNFAYEVNSEEGAQYSHQENAEAGVISGEYRVNLPDGRIQIVR